jgi:hypothetical protein
MKTHSFSIDEETKDVGQDISAAGTSSEDITLNVVPNALTNPDLQMARARYVQLLAADSLVLYINGEKQPILIQKSGKTVLGRYKAVQETHAIDLSMYYAHLLGVSREHAVISFIDDTWWLEDLNSSNGTWVNEIKVGPNQPTALHDGDIIRLGHLQIIISF